MPGSQFGPPSGSAGASSNTVAIGNVNVSTQPAGAVTVQPISLTPTPRIAANTTRDISPASLPDKNAAASGRAYEPISIFDANQYTQFQLPDYAAEASQAAIYTMIGRYAAPDQAATLMIDTFWNGKAPDLAGSTGKNPLDGKVSFADAVAIEPGKTNIAELLKSGAVVIGGAPGQWLLATGLTADAKSMLAIDPVSGKVVAFTLDEATGAMGGFAGYYDAKLKGISPSADVSGQTGTGRTNDAIKDFAATSFITFKHQ